MTRRHLQAIEQPVDDVRALDDIAHEQEQGHRRQHVVGHDRIGLVGKQEEDLVVQELLPRRVIGIESEPEPHRHQRKEDRKAEQDRQDEDAQHEDCDLRVGHEASPLPISGDPVSDG